MAPVVAILAGAFKGCKAFTGGPSKSKKVPVDIAIQEMWKRGRVRNYELSGNKRYLKAYTAVTSTSELVRQARSAPARTSLKRRSLSLAEAAASQLLAHMPSKKNATVAAPPQVQRQRSLT